MTTARTPTRFRDQSITFANGSKGRCKGEVEGGVKILVNPASLSKSASAGKG